METIIPKDLWLQAKLKQSAHAESRRLKAEANPAPKKQTTKPVRIKCQRCGGFNVRVYKQQAKNGVRHLRADCANCKRFIKFLSQH